VAVWDLAFPAALACLGLAACASGSPGDDTALASSPSPGFDASVSEEAAAQPQGEAGGGDAAEAPTVPDTSTDVATEGDGCVPACAGKQCGPDGCGAGCPPGCASGKACSAAGQCEGGCAATFTAAFPDAKLRALLAEPPSGLWVAGAYGKSGYVATLNPCTGAVLATVSIDTPGAASTSLVGMAAGGADLFVAGNATAVGGTDPGAAMAARIPKSALVPLWSVALKGTAALDEARFVAVDDAAGVWAGGYDDKSLLAPRLFRIEPSGEHCGFPGFGQFGSPNAAASAPGSKAIHVVGQSGDDSFIARYPSGGCWSGGACSDTTECAPDWKATLKVGSSITVVRAMVIVGGYAYVVGHAQKTAGKLDTSGFVAAVSLASGGVGALYQYDPTTLGDSFAAIAAEGTNAAYAVGVRGWDGAASYAGAKRAIVKLLLPTLDLVWTHESPTERVGWAVGLDGSDGVLVASDSAAGSSVTRCTTAGLCP
jgi:hypothetical protein